jgi:hypothetical protein
MQEIMMGYYSKAEGKPESALNNVLPFNCFSTSLSLNESMSPFT